jgi:hypothetical protein
MHMMKRGLLALTMVAAAGGTTVGLLASQASASPTRGAETLKTVQYEVGAGKAVGPFNAHGAVNTQGNIADIASKPGDPDGSSRVQFVDPTGSWTILATGGKNPQQSLNPVTCAVRFSLQDLHANIVSGTGAYRHATGAFKADVSVKGYQPRLANGSCNANVPSAFEVDTVTASGHINLH